MNTITVYELKLKTITLPNNANVAQVPEDFLETPAALDFSVKPVKIRKHQNLEILEIYIDGQICKICLDDKLEKLFNILKTIAHDKASMHNSEIIRRFEKGNSNLKKNLNAVHLSNEKLLLANDDLTGQIKENNEKSRLIKFFELFKL